MKRTFYTPKSAKLKALFSSYLGISDYTLLWKTKTQKDIDDFVSNRGEIAHNGNKATYVTMSKLEKYQDMVLKNVKEIDSNMAIELRNMSGLAILPWINKYPEHF